MQGCPVEGSEHARERPVLRLDVEFAGGLGGTREGRHGQGGSDQSDARQRLDARDHQTFSLGAAVAPANPAPPPVTGSLIDFGNCRGVSNTESSGRITRKWMK